MRKTSSSGSDLAGREAGERAGAEPIRAERQGRRKSARPLDQVAARDLALSYVARFATTGAKLERYLHRKIRERGVAEDADGRPAAIDVAALVASFVEAGYVDDAAYARARANDLSQRGYGARRVEQDLWAAGVDDHLREVHAPGEAQGRHAAVLLARKRRFGPFGADRTDGDDDPAARRKQRDRQVAAMLRAGHSYSDAAAIIDAPDERQVEE